MSGPLDFDGGEREGDDERDLRHREDPDLHTLPDRPRRARFGPGAIGSLALLGFVVFVSASVLTGGDDQGGGARGPAIGSPTPIFSAPRADGPTKKEFNVNVLAKPTKGYPAACTVHSPDAVNGCDLWKDGPAALVFFATASGKCVQQVDIADRVRRSFPKVSFVAISLGGERGKTRELLRKRGWGMPVAYDLAGILGSRYGVAVCPHVTFVRQGGRVAGTDIGDLDEAEWRGALKALEAGKPIPGAI